ncbi:hypothetical protein HN681_03460 [archaeon]|jgi:hypothetical protein|nr:hypothetical protein [archaeon]MBT7402921.1 hypothetical protein [Candidatus Woesearchaeota archaeon]MBT3730818.1 hypothetical protein [archaeon]MBT4670132.1 hypothetical protein [archaeon]MBT7052619.1 hypothetical protein [archaeon]
MKERKNVIDNLTDFQKDLLIFLALFGHEYKNLDYNSQTVYDLEEIREYEKKGFKVKELEKEGWIERKLIPEYLGSCSPQNIWNMTKKISEKTNWIEVDKKEYQDKIKKRKHEKTFWRLKRGIKTQRDLIKSFALSSSNIKEAKRYLNLLPKSFKYIHEDRSWIKIFSHSEYYKKQEKRTIKKGLYLSSYPLLKEEYLVNFYEEAEELSSECIRRLKLHLNFFEEQNRNERVILKISKERLNKMKKTSRRSKK